MAQFEELRRITLGVPLVTLHNPDASPEDERSYQTKRGQEAKGSGGRPRDKKPGHKTRERKEKLPKVSKLALEQLISDWKPAFREQPRDTFVFAGPHLAGFALDLG